MQVKKSLRNPLNDIVTSFPVQYLSSIRIWKYGWTQHTASKLFQAKKDKNIRKSYADKRKKKREVFKPKRKKSKLLLGMNS